MRRLFLMACVMGILCSLMLVGTRWIGATARSSSTVIALVRQQSAIVEGQWCLHNLCPGHTRYFAAEPVLAALPKPPHIAVGMEGRVESYPASIWRYRAVWRMNGNAVSDVVAQGTDHDESLASLTVNTRGLNVTLADFLLSFGTPFTLRTYGQYLALLCTEDGVCAVIEPGEPHIRLRTALTGIMYIARLTDLSAWFVAQPYHGIRRLDR